MTNNTNNFFPYENIREGQKEFLNDVIETVISRKILIAHAPTGIGKTAAVLGGSLKFALENEKTIIFLTPKHTQHIIVMDTLKKIKEKFNINFCTVDIIGKQHLCMIKDVDEISPSQFHEYCRVKKEKGECEYFENTHKTRNELTVIKILERIKDELMSSEEIKKISENFNFCPYEIAMRAAKISNVIICDYFHIFSKPIREAFLERIGKNLDEIILIVDEAHNLPNRIREISQSSISEITIERAIKEAKKINDNILEKFLYELKEILKNLKPNVKIENRDIKNNEWLIERKKFIEKVEEIAKIFGENYSYDDIIIHLGYVGEEIISENKISYIKSISKFLYSWKIDEPSFVRILSLKTSKRTNEKYLSLRNICLDPSIVSKEIFNECYSAILMSGTLTPLKMYSEILGIEEKRAILREYKSPFPKENRVIIITKGLTTKFTSRSEDMFERYANKIYEISKYVDGNIAVFFPSYQILDKIFDKIFNYNKENKNTKKIIREYQEMDREERKEILEELKNYKESGGALLFAVMSGSLSEGVDYPDNLLKAIIIVGLPLNAPDLETKSLIEYYDIKFNMGWEYGYIYPAINKVIQASGRGIRSEKDRCIIILMDERYKWSNYHKCLPSEFAFITTYKPEDYVKNFWKK